MGAKFERLARGDRWWAAEAGLRGLGLALLGICAALAAWLHRSLNQPPAHSAGSLEIAAAALAVLCLTLGLALVAEGPGLFRLIPVPGRLLIS